MTESETSTLTYGRGHSALLRPELGRGAPVLTQIKHPPPAPGELICRTLVAGVCGTDLQIFSGTRGETAQVLGHEGLGVVETVGLPADKPLIGKRIAVNPTDAKTGAEFGHSINGMMQELFVVPQRLRHLVLDVPAELDAELAILAEPLASVLAFATIVRSVSRPRRIALFGRGTIAHLIRLVAQDLFPSVKDVVVISRGDSQSYEPQGFDLSVMCSSIDAADWAANLSVEALSDGGVLYLFGGLPPGLLLPSLAYSDIGSLRARNTGGELGNKPTETLQHVKDGRVIVLAGHRGASNTLLLEAMQRITRSAEHFRPLVNQVVHPREAERLLKNAFEGLSTRQWTKLGIDFRRSKK